MARSGRDGSVDSGTAEWREKARLIALFLRKIMTDFACAYANGKGQCWRRSTARVRSYDLAVRLVAATRSPGY